MTETVEDNRDELARRHRAASLFVLAMAALTLTLIALAFAGVLIKTSSLSDPALEGSLRIAIVLFGFGAVVLRRTRFSPARLRDIASLRGVSGLLATLQKTTVLVALIGGAVAVMGFVVAMVTGNEYDMLWLGLIALAVLLYAYPRRAAWRRVVDTMRAADGVEAEDTTRRPKGTTA